MTRLFALLLIALLFTLPLARAQSTKLNNNINPEPLRAVILPLGIPTSACPHGGTIGTHIHAHDYLDAMHKLRLERIDIVIVKVSAGFSLDSAIASQQEVRRLASIFDQYSNHFRTVAWIENATDASALAIYGLRELYFSPIGHLGAAVPLSDLMTAAEGAELDRWLSLGEERSRQAGRDPAIMRAMQTIEPLSATIADDAIVWEQSEAGQHLVNRRGHNLTLSADEALRFRISRGTAASTDELLKLMGIAEGAATIITSPAALEVAQRTRERCTAAPARR